LLLLLLLLLCAVGRHAEYGLPLRTLTVLLQLLQMLPWVTIKQ
jgi:hypothetical protein